MRICRSLGIASVGEAHRIVVAGVRKGVKTLLERGLDAQALCGLGYDSAGMKKLEYGEDDLKSLGYEVASGSEGERAAAGQWDPHRPLRPQLEETISAGCRANELKQAGFTLHHCRTAGYDARELARLGFTLNELASEYGIHELKRVGFGVPELRLIFSGPELRSAGFTATDMRNAGYSIRELLSFGYSENQIRAAGFSNRELAHAGLSRTTVDKTPLQNW